VRKAHDEEKQRRKQEHDDTRQKQEQKQRKQEIESEQTMIGETGGWEEVDRNQTAKLSGGGQVLGAATASGALVLEAAAVIDAASAPHSTRGVGGGGGAWSRMQSGGGQQGVVGVTGSEDGDGDGGLRGAELMFARVDEALRLQHIRDERKRELERAQTLQREAEEGAKQAERKDEARRL